MQVTDSIKPSNPPIKIENIKEPYILGVSGGSGSGKTFFAKDLQNHLGPENCNLIFQDNYYFDQSHRFDFDGGAVNFDHPDSIDFSLMAQNIMDLRSMKPIEMPLYDFKTHTRPKSTQKVYPKKILIIDGILIFHSPALRIQMSELVFFDTPEELRFERRLNRDIHERGGKLRESRSNFIRK